MKSKMKKSKKRAAKLPSRAAIMKEVEAIDRRRRVGVKVNEVLDHLPKGVRMTDAVCAVALVGSVVGGATGEAMMTGALVRLLEQWTKAPPASLAFALTDDEILERAKKIGEERAQKQKKSVVEPARQDELSRVFDYDYGYEHALEALSSMSSRKTSS